MASLLRVGFIQPLYRLPHGVAVPDASAQSKDLEDWNWNWIELEFQSQSQFEFQFEFRFRKDLAGLRIGGREGGEDVGIVTDSLHVKEVAPLPHSQARWEGRDLLPGRHLGSFILMSGS